MKGTIIMKMKCYFKSKGKPKQNFTHTAIEFNFGWKWMDYFQKAAKLFV